MEQIKCFEDEILISQIKNSKTRQIASIIENRLIFYKYPQAEKIILSFLSPRFLRADVSTNDRGLIYFLSGDYHTGKSFLLKYFAYVMKKCFPEIWKVHELPIAKIDLNNHINTAQQLLLYLLEKLGRPVDGSLLNQWKKTNSINQRLQDRLIRLLEQFGTRVLILDECQKLLISRNPDISDIFELLKDLTTRQNWHGKLRTQIILCGTNDGIPMLEAAQWIQGRTRIMKLQELKDDDDYGSLLLTIYRDYLSLGVSDEWGIVTSQHDAGVRTLNEEIAHYFRQRTHGKVGLSVDLIRNATLLALDEGRFYPEMKDYESIRLDEKSYILETNSSKICPKKEKHKIHISLQDRTCIMKGCKKSNKPYTRYNSLIQHYKIKHPNIELIYGAE